MSGETSSRALGPDRAAARRRSGTGRRPFSPAEGEPRQMLGTTRPDEPAGDDRWTAVTSAFLFAVLAALLAWMLMAIARG